MTAERRIELFDIPFMKAWAFIRGESFNPRIEMPPAAVVLPYEAGHVYLFRTPHPDTKVPTLKTVGGYCKKDETPEECARRNLEARLGLLTKDLQPLGPVLAYVHARIPTYMFLATQLEHLEQEFEPVAGPTFIPVVTERVRVSYDEAYSLVERNELMDDASSIPIMRLLLRDCRPRL